MMVIMMIYSEKRHLLIQTQTLTTLLYFDLLLPPLERVQKLQKRLSQDDGDDDDGDDDDNDVDGDVYDENKLFLTHTQTRTLTTLLYFDCCCHLYGGNGCA